MKFSVLLSVYKNEKPEYLSIALKSIVNQSLLPTEIVIVEDGVLTPELDEVIQCFKDRYKNLIKLLPFKENRGLGLALRDGVLACSYEYIARMDTDDIACHERFAKQLAYLKKHPEVAMVGSWITEFSQDPQYPDTITKLPCAYKEIVAYAKKRNPFRHMTVIYKKSAVMNSGNYRDCLWFEDYDLWVRMIQKGYKVANIPEVLVNVRADDAMFARRGGWKYWEQEVKFQKFLYVTNYINLVDFSTNFILRSVVRLLPNQLRSFFYNNFLRKRY
ncbi:glycosyltransferase [uncultured Phascolarctobacterium sp.]|uniref:glycosyltransferase n=1 Tax=uncultured Phascolarctobacterium sp. TaxID=512296 RepID=UPI0026336FBD|nr:glycosyltransferase [uncultured Phascolarctobacterium sp.]